MTEKRKTAGETAIQKLTYEGNSITFATGDNVMMNATQMCKPFGKTTKDWLVNKSTREFLNMLSSVRGIPLTDLVVIYQGGTNQGTWMHEDVAIEFARWLSPKFAIWCNDRIKDMVRGTVTSKVLPTGKVKPRELSSELAAFYVELRQWVRRIDVQHVGERAGVTEGHVMKVMRGTGMSVSVLQLLVEKAAGNRTKGLHTDIRCRLAAKVQMRQLAFNFMGEGGAK